MSIFPEFIEEIQIENNEQLPMFREYAINFNDGSFLYTENGKNIILQKNEAIKVWIWKALQVNRNKYRIYSKNYGNEFEELIGKGYSKEFIDSEIYRLVEECLLVNRYIKSIEGVESKFEGSKVIATIKIKTVYGEVKLDV
ncbi:DUF2634 domain-containing protein [Clostridium ihumii]|uniref:DUF2634 domain-containing protein n=1 Tax=Clostridium ihumii TaxID=1470356 RepID=UPI000688077A|nr:DUF2634 domain-containing protein [Clostridium ihumii]